jgi:glycerophosphoryl diester phosphodiesterase
MATTISETTVLAPRRTRTDRPIVIAHRGASGYRPEHTLEAYRLAVELGADYIEPDLVSTKDGVLVARHENNLLGTTDVALRPEFADRRTTRLVDGRQVTGWFTEDFTVAEIKTLRATERLPLVRPGNVVYDGRFEIPTFDEVLQLADDESRRTGREIGVAPETKHPSYFAELGLAPEPPLVRSLKAFGLDRADAPVIIQSFEVDNLRSLDQLTAAPIVQLVDLHQAERLTPSGLREISTYAEWVGPHKCLVLPTPHAGPSPVADEAHRAGLRVVAWTVREENQFLAPAYRLGTDPNARGDFHAEVAALVEAGIDAVFADYPDSVSAALVG